MMSVYPAGAQVSVCADLTAGQLAVFAAGANFEVRTDLLLDSLGPVGLPIGT